MKEYMRSKMKKGNQETGREEVRQETSLERIQGVKVDQKWKKKKKNNNMHLKAILKHNLYKSHKIPHSTDAAIFRHKTKPWQQR